MTLILVEAGALYVPQPWAYLLSTGEATCVSCSTPPPDSAMGKTTIHAEGLNKTACSEWLRRGGTTLPTAKRGLSLLAYPHKPGKFVEDGPVRRFVPNPRYGIGEPVMVDLPLHGLACKGTLEGWIQTADGKSIGQCRPGSTAKFSRRSIRGEVCGPYIWVFRLEKP